MPLPGLSNPNIRLPGLPAPNLPSPANDTEVIVEQGVDVPDTDTDGNVRSGGRPEFEIRGDDRRRGAGLQLSRWRTC